MINIAKNIKTKKLLFTVIPSTACAILLFILTIGFIDQLKFYRKKNKDNNTLNINEEEVTISVRNSNDIQPFQNLCAKLTVIIKNFCTVWVTDSNGAKSINFSFAINEVTMSNISNSKYTFDKNKSVDEIILCLRQNKEIWENINSLVNNIENILENLKVVTHNFNVLISKIDKLKCEADIMNIDSSVSNKNYEIVLSLVTNIISAISFQMKQIEFLQLVKSTKLTLLERVSMESELSIKISKLYNILEESVIIASIDFSENSITQYINENIEYIRKNESKTKSKNLQNKKNKKLNIKFIKQMSSMNISLCNLRELSHEIRNKKDKKDSFAILENFVLCRLIFDFSNYFR